jgi:hypothetical protein
MILASTAPRQGFIAAVQTAINFFQSTFSVPITVNIGVGWGEAGGYSIGSGALGEERELYRRLLQLQPGTQCTNRQRDIFD